MEAIVWRDLSTVCQVLPASTTVAVGGTTHMETLLVREESCAKRLRGVVHEGLLRDDATGEPSAR